MDFGHLVVPTLSSHMVVSHWKTLENDIVRTMIM